MTGDGRQEPREPDERGPQEQGPQAEAGAVPHARTPEKREPAGPDRVGPDRAEPDEAGPNPAGGTQEMKRETREKGAQRQERPTGTAEASASPAASTPAPAPAAASAALSAEEEAAQAPSHQVPEQRGPHDVRVDPAPRDGQGGAPVSDTELLERMRDGDDAAYEELYRRHVEPVRRYARTCCRDADTAEDLAGEVFARTLQAVRGGKGPRTAVRTYLLTSVRHVAAAWTRSQRRERLVDDFAVFVQSAAAASAAPDADTLDLAAEVRAMREAEQTLVVRAFRSLSEHDRMLLWHTAVEGGKPQDVALLLGTSRGAAATAAHRAREHLKQAYLQAHVSQARTRDEECARYADRLGAYARGGLRMRAERGLTQHLAECAECSQAASEVKDLNEHIRLLLPVALIGWFGTAGGAKAFAALLGGGAAAGGAAAGGAGGSGAGAGAASEGLGTPAKVGIGLGVAAAAGAALAYALTGGDEPPKKPEARHSAPPAAPAPPRHTPDPAPRPPEPHKPRPPAPKPRPEPPRAAPAQHAPKPAPPRRPAPEPSAPAPPSKPAPKPPEPSRPAPPPPSPKPPEPPVVDQHLVQVTDHSVTVSTTVGGRPVRLVVERKPSGAPSVELRLSSTRRTGEGASGTRPGPRTPGAQTPGSRTPGVQTPGSQRPGPRTPGSASDVLP